MTKFLSLCCILLTWIGLAQQDINVTVIDLENNQSVSNIDIKLQNENQGINITKTTNEKGQVVFKNILPLNGYKIVFEGNATYAQQQSEQIDIRSNENINLPFYLVSKDFAEQSLDEVLITQQKTSRINRRDAEVSFELEAQEIEEIPVEGRDITRVLFRIPNVTQATGFFPEAPNVSINGANSLFTSYLIDGLDNNERFLGGQRFAIPAGFVKDITVLTSNFSAEYGLTNNGVIDITTKSGGNEHHGEVFFVTRPGPEIDGQTDFAQRDLSGNLVQDGFARYQSGFAVGGPIVKDKTFYFVNFEHTTDQKDNLLNSPDLGVVETVEGTNTFNYFSAKIDQIWQENFRSSLRANVGVIDIERQGGGLEGGVTFPSAGNAQERNSINLALKNAYNIGNMSFETNLLYGRFRWNYADPDNDASPQVTVRNPADQPIAIVGHPGFVFDEIENTLQFQQKFKWYLDNHTIKAGFNYISGDHELFGGGNPNGNYIVRLTEDQLNTLNNQNIGGALNVDDIPSDAEVVNYGVELRPSSFGTTQNITSFYIEDLWEINDKLNATIGLRYDYDNLSEGGSTDGDTDNIAPRLNFNYKLTENSVIRGGYAIAYDKINYAIYSDALQLNNNSEDYKLQIQELVNQGLLPADTDIDRVTFNGNLTANFSNVNFLEGPTPADLAGSEQNVFSNERRILNPNGYDNPYSHQFTLGYQVQLENDKLFFVDVMHNLGRNLFRLRNLNAAEPFPIDSNFSPDDVRSIEEADATRPIPIVNGVGIINGQEVEGVARNVVITETEGESEYWAASFNLQKARGQNNYSYRINYTLSSLKNDTEDINFRAMDANNFDAEWGPSINDRTHNINGIFNYYPFEGTTITLAALLQSGQPINRIPDGEVFGTTDLNGDGSGFGDAYVGNSDRSPGESRNNDRLPWNNTFDVGIQHQFKLGNNHRLEFRADIFNVLNAENLSGFFNNATQSNQIQAGPASSGRFVQRNAGPPRQFQFGVRYLF
ncbi:TonB-dependent receptor plug domain-containing protein [Flavobacteriaceae bacterium 14752]|uniref:TonB-dependent receptor plug domain-containing protein n=1 Tax=Mesohalobacter salilacus TaxID=2491711 RepID=UPI000F63E68B|nr:TonB-dependent receptor [Flavobacteriaceae bacterium 14752]